MTEAPLPELELRPRLAQLLAAPRVEPYRAAMLASLRVGWRLVPERTAHVKVGMGARLLGRRAQAPQLPLAASKRGGVPYLAQASDWPRGRAGQQLPFVAQINFGELPSLGARGPKRGIFALFAGDDAPGFVWRWYPEPQDAAPHRGGGVIGAALDGPTTDEWEQRLRAAISVSVAFDAWWDEPNEVVDHEEFDRLTAWAEDEGASVGGWTVATMTDVAGPRAWLGPAARGDDAAPWIRLWEEPVGSLFVTIVVRAADFDEGRLDRCAVIEWQ